MLPRIKVYPSIGVSRAGNIDSSSQRIGALSNCIMQCHTILIVTVLEKHSLRYEPVRARRVGTQ